MVRAIRIINWYGSRKIQRNPRERIVVARRVLSQNDIKKGESSRKRTWTVKRPGSGISPMKWFEVTDIRLCEF